MMPLKSPAKDKPEHCPRLRDQAALWNVLVARPVSRKEALANPDAKKALVKEWDKLRAQGVSDESKVRPWSEVKAEARRAGKTVHVGRIFDICVEKNSELPASDPRRKYKGRVVFGGNDVRDQNAEAALFQDLGSSPATMEARKFCDMYSLLEGHSAQQADAVSAYTQAKLGTKSQTCIRVPRHAWPEGGKLDYPGPGLPTCVGSVRTSRCRRTLGAVRV